MTSKLTRLTDEELAELAFYAGESTCHPDQNYQLGFESLATGSSVLSIVRELQERRKADSEPVAYIFKHPAGRLFWSLTDESNKGHDDVMPVYAAPQPVPVVPEKATVGEMPFLGTSEGAYVRGWNACRAAMLTAVPHDTPALNSVQSVVTVPDRWIPVSERMPESNGVYFGWDGQRVLEVNCFFGGWSANQFIHGEITHWMPLPAAPQEVK
ncbi:DUF551 domain-containing protein [Raoultella planticola]|uniref:DUF551 domain-containing protein n=1 Tax=Raoultella planticola TaxID=575 RepID=UPI00115A5C51|nr:DUF551 domain-containing protein [Raoultella planticola]